MDILPEADVIKVKALEHLRSLEKNYNQQPGFYPRQVVALAIEATLVAYNAAGILDAGECRNWRVMEIPEHLDPLT